MTELKPPRCHSRPGEAPKLVLWGDSHGAAWQPAAWEIAESLDVSAAVLSMGSCTPMVGEAGRRADVATFAANCRRFNELALEFIRSGGVQTLVLASRWPAAYPDARGGAAPDRPRSAGHQSLAELEASLDRTLGELHSIPRVLVFLPIPEIRRPAAECAGLAVVEECAYSRADFARIAGPSTRMLQRLAARHRNVELVDPAPFFCDAVRCRVMHGGHSLYWDDNHVAASASKEFGDAFVAEPAAFALPRSPLPAAAVPGGAPR